MEEHVNDVDVNDDDDEEDEEEDDDNDDDNNEDEEEDDDEEDDDEDDDFIDIYTVKELEKFLFENCIELPTEITFHNELAKQKLIMYNNKVYRIDDYKKEKVIYEIKDDTDLYNLKIEILKKSKLTRFKFKFDTFLSLYTSNTFITKIILSLITFGPPKFSNMNRLYRQILQDSFDSSKNIANHSKFFINDEYFLIPYNHRILDSEGCFFKIDKKLWHRTLVLEFTKHFVSTTKRKMNFQPTFTKATFIENFELEYFVMHIFDFNDILTMRFRSFFTKILYDYMVHFYSSNLGFLKEKILQISPSHYGERILFSRLNTTLNINSDSINLVTLETDQSKNFSLTNYDNVDIVKYLDMFVSLFSKKRITRCELTWPNKKNIFQGREENYSLLDFEHLFLKNVLCSAFTLVIDTISLGEDNSKKKRVNTKIYFVPVRIQYDNVITDTSNVYSIYENEPPSLKNITSEDTFLSFYKTSNSAEEFTNKITNFEIRASFFHNLGLLDKSFNILLENYPEILEANKNNNFKIVDYNFLSLNNNNIKFIENKAFNYRYKFFYYFEID